MDERNYHINIDPRILELLGPHLYTNIYYVLAELIANAYDADASNVYILEKQNCIIVEDDGNGMSYRNGDIAQYLNVAAETRSGNHKVYTASGKRRRMGRKGVGKLAALSVSENVNVMTRCGGEISGFVLSRHVEKDKQLRSLKDEEIKFQCIGENSNGTSIVMTAPQYGLHKTPAVIRKNLLKIFPLVDSSFNIHIETARGKISIGDFDKEIVGELAGLILLGKNFHYLSGHFQKEGLPPDILKKLLLLKNVEAKPITLKNSSGKAVICELLIEGWIGAYRSTRGRKSDNDDFPDNFISLLSNKKLGEFNILPLVGKNRLNEVYVVGQIHVDLFEETSLPDMALSNRQGYKSDDPRYTAVLSYLRDELLPTITETRAIYAAYQKSCREALKQKRYSDDEVKLRDSVTTYKKTASKNIAKKIAADAATPPQEELQMMIESEMDDLMPLVGLKKKVDKQKRKILISHASVNKPLADVIYNMLSLNNVPDSDMIYTSCDSAECRVPEGAYFFEYLEEFFVNSSSLEGIYVIYVTSDEMAKDWFAVTEVGAGWITKKDHCIFNIKDHQPMRPLNTNPIWHNSKIFERNIYMTNLGMDQFIEKILYVCNSLGYAPLSKAKNLAELTRYVELEVSETASII